MKGPRRDSFNDENVYRKRHLMLKRLKNFKSKAGREIPITMKNYFQLKKSKGSVRYSKQDIDDPRAAKVQRQSSGDVIMFVNLRNKKRRITFGITNERCTVQNLLEQARIFPEQDPRVSLVRHPTLGINYIVDVSESRITPA